MSTALRIAAVAASLVTVGAFAPPAQAYNAVAYVFVDGETKAEAYVNTATGRFCPNLIKGNLATASLNGATKNDYTAGDGEVCSDVALRPGNTYRLNLTWQGTAGRIENGFVTFKAS